MLGVTKKYKLSTVPVVIYKYIMSNKSSPDDTQKYEGAGTGVPRSWKFGSKLYLVKFAVYDLAVYY